MKEESVYALIVLFGLVAGTAWAAERSKSRSDSKPYGFQKALGKPVKDQQGEELGRIHDIVFDPQGRVPFAVLSEGGLWGVGGKLVAVPFNALAFGSDEYFTLNATKEELASAPGFNRNDLSDQKWAENVYRYFGLQPCWIEGGQIEESGSTAQEDSMGKGVEDNQIP